MVDGDVIVHGDDVTDLDMLECVREITGRLHIYGNDALVDVSGVYWLERLGGDLLVFDNDALVEFDGLAVLQALEQREHETQPTWRVDSGLAIVRNASLQRIRGLAALEVVPGGVFIRDNPSLSNIEGLAGLETVETLAITHNAQLCPLALAGVTDTLVVGDDLFTEGNGSGCDEVPRPDPGPRWECDKHAQNCPAGMKCIPWSNDGGGSWNALRCSDVAEAPKRIGEPCTVDGSGVSGLDDCERGAMCWDVNPRTNTGTCVEIYVLNAGNPGCSDAMTVSVTASGGPIQGLCLPMCNPLANECEPQQGCVWRVKGSGRRGFWCSGVYEGEVGEVCDYRSCVPGLSCTWDDGSPAWVGGEGNTCKPHCSLSSPNCPDGWSCQPWYAATEEPPGHEDVGICLPQ